MREGRNHFGLHASAFTYACARGFAERHLTRYTWWMSKTLEIVRITARWAHGVVDAAESRGGTIPSPRLAEFQLGRLIHRSDPETAIGIAEDVVGQRWPDAPELVLEACEAIRACAAPLTARSRARHSPRAYWLAVELIRRLRAGRSPEQRRLLEQGARARSWAALASGHWPGRDGLSLRDDFQRMADDFWRREKFFLSQVAETIVKEGTIKEPAA
jgi:hypothetical protein